MKRLIISNVCRLTPKKSGQTLVEVLIAFAVTVLIGVGLVSAGLATQKAAASARNESQATKLAQEYLEQVRAMRDSKTWNTFILPFGSVDNNFAINNSSQFDVNVWAFTSSWSNSAPTYCLGNSASATPLHGASVKVGNTEFCRKIRITNNVSGALSLGVTAEVGWKEGDNIRSVKAETRISRWCGSTITGANASPCP